MTNPQFLSFISSLSVRKEKQDTPPVPSLTCICAAERWTCVHRSRMTWSWHSGGRGSLLSPAGSILTASLWPWGRRTRRSHRSQKSRRDTRKTHGVNSRIHAERNVIGHKTHVTIFQKPKRRPPTQLLRSTANSKQSQVFIFTFLTQRIRLS